MKPIRLLMFLIILSASGLLCHQIITLSLFNQNSKNDFAELNHIKYGLFSVDDWKRHIAVILAEEINDMDLSASNQQALQEQLETVMTSLIDEVDRKIREGHAGSATGWLKQSLLDIFVSLEDVKKGIPQYAHSVVIELKKEETKGKLKAILIEKLDQYLRKTFGTKNKAQIKSILQRTKIKDVEMAKERLSNIIEYNRDLIFKETMALAVLSVAVFSLVGFGGRPLSPPMFFLLLWHLVLLLIAGVATPMIDMEAKISHLSFVLLGHTIRFENQVLYFQCKSILDVFQIMITHKDPLMKFVGILLVTFSVVFPVSKLCSSFAYYYNYHNARENGLIKFFVLKSGKWSMADVMVVAIFMAYVGFNGILKSQLGQLSSKGPQLDLIATNGTALQPGYYLFLAFVVLSLFFSGFITRKPKAVEPEDA